MAHYSSQFSITRLWLIFAIAMVAMFGVLLYFGAQIYQAKPPIPLSVQTLTGEVVYSRADIERGQSLWQSMGGMEQGSIWGHGSYVAPDWSADWLHREALTSLEIMAREQGAASYSALPGPEQSAGARYEDALQFAVSGRAYDASANAP